jgi:hypothetical protein
VYIDTDRLGIVNPIEAASLLNSAQAACAAERVRAEAAEAASTQLSHKSDALRDRVTAIAADLEACRLELAAAGGEAKGLLMANEMAERACSALRSELFSTRQALASAQIDGAQSLHRARHLESRLADMEAQLANTAARLANTEAQRENTTAQLVNTLASHSWRVTAPLRRISRTLYRRP